MCTFFSKSLNQIKFEEASKFLEPDQEEGVITVRVERKREAQEKRNCTHPKLNNATHTITITTDLESIPCYVGF